MPGIWWGNEMINRTVLLTALFTCAPVFSQWVNYPTPGAPRLPDGKLNLAAPAPKTAAGKPDLSGMWESLKKKPPIDIEAWFARLDELGGRDFLPDGIPDDPLD